MMRKFFTAMTMLLASFAGAWADGVYFNYEPGPDQHLIYVSLTNAEGTVFTQANGLSDGDYYLGAFIGNECRGEAHVEYLAVDEGKNLFTLYVHGNRGADNGQSITFRVYKRRTAEDWAEYRIPAETANVTFKVDDVNNRTGEPSNPYKIQFVPATGITFSTNPITVEIYDQVNMLNYITPEPANGLIPYPHIWNCPTDFVSIGDDILDANGVTFGAPVNVQLQAGQGGCAKHANTMVNVINPATKFEWMDEHVTNNETDGSKGTISLVITDEGMMVGLLNGGYKLTGKEPTAPSTTTYTWTSNNADVVSIDEEGHVSFVAAGTAILTGTPVDGSILTHPQLMVNVIQPITEFDFGFNNENFVVEVGANITEYLNSVVTVTPEEATDKTFDIVIPEGYENYFEKVDGKVMAKNPSSAVLQTLSFSANGVPLTLKANDIGQYEQTIRVIIIPMQPKNIAPKQTTIHKRTPDVLPQEITEELYANLQLTPDTMNIDNWWDKISLQTANPEVVSQIDESYDEKGRPRFNLNGKGTALITVAMTIADPSQVSVFGDNASFIFTSLPTFSFIVDVQDGLSAFTFDNVTTVAGETVEVTLTPQPEGAEFDASKISVSVTPSVTMPTGWKFADVAAKSGDATGLKWTVTSHSAGKGTITVSYQKESGPVDMGTGDLVVEQQLALNNGWQWVSLYQGKVEGKDTLEQVFGDNLGEIRANSSVVYNDTKYGYFGELSNLETLQTYKLRMKLDAPTSVNIPAINNASTYFDNNSTASGNTLDMSVRKGWNWLGNPYQYYQKLSDVFGNTPFAKGDIIKGKTAFATYTDGAWAGELKYLTPGEGYMVQMGNAGTISFNREFTLSQQTEVPAASRSLAPSFAGWTIDHSGYADNMAMIAHVGGLADVSRLTIYAFAGNECRGRGITEGDRQFITIHGRQGERFTFVAYDEQTQTLYELVGSRAFAPVSGTYAAPVPLFVGGVTTVEAIRNQSAVSNDLYDLQGRRVDSSASGLAAPLKKGIYVRQGKKVVK